MSEFVNLTKEEHKFVSPFHPMMDSIVAHQKLPLFWSKLLKACFIAGLLEARGKGLDAMDTIIDARQFAFKEFSALAELIQPMDPKDISGMKVKIGSVELSFN